MIIIITFIQMILVCMIIVFFTNFIRFTFSIKIQKLILIFMALLIIFILSPITHTAQHELLLIGFIVIASCFFHLYGGILAALFGWIIFSIQRGQPDLVTLITFLLISIFIGISMMYLSRKKDERKVWNGIVIKNAKLLNLYKEVSVFLQQTTDLNRILHIITTSITTSHGLGFNRAIVLLTNDNETVLKGTIGAGSTNAREEFKVWEKTAEDHFKLTDLIDNVIVDESIHYEICKQVKDIEIPLHLNSFLNQVMESHKPYHVKSVNLTDKEQHLLYTLFDMKEFVILPMINYHHKIGVLIIDNIVNKRPISTEAIDSVIPIVNQAAIAIQQSYLYSQIENMALKDGLSGLMNLRALEKKLDSFYTSETWHNLSCVMIDIDYFKNYNDKNGHILGNQVIKKLANLMISNTRAGDFSFRFGGEEFTILLPHTLLDEAILIAERLRIAVEKTAFPKAYNQPFGFVSISLGVASTLNLTAQTPEDLITAADRALYYTKSLGKNQVFPHGRGVQNQ